MSAEVYKGEIKEQKEALQDKERGKASASAKKNGKQSMKKQKGMFFVED